MSHHRLNQMTYVCRYAPYYQGVFQTETQNSYREVIKAQWKHWFDHLAQFDLADNKSGTLWFAITLGNIVMKPVQSCWTLQSFCSLVTTQSLQNTGKRLLLLCYMELNPPPNSYIGLRLYSNVRDQNSLWIFILVRDIVMENARLSTSFTLYYMLIFFQITVYLVLNKPGCNRWVVNTVVWDHGKETGCCLRHDAVMTS